MMKPRNSALRWGGTGKYCRFSSGITGNVKAIEFKEKPEGYTQLGDKYQMLFYPKASVKANAEILEKLRAIVVIDEKEVTEVIGFKSPQCIGNENGFGWVTLPTTIFHKDFILLDVPDKCTFTPNSDTFEILGSEYIQLEILTRKEVSNG